MNSFCKLFIPILSAITFFSQIEAVQVVSVPIDNSPSEQATSLDLSYVDGGDYITGQLFDEEELTQKILSNLNLVELNLSGQTITLTLMTVIHDNLTQLKKLTIKGSIHFDSGDGLFYSGESINQQIISDEMLQALFDNSSPIEVMDLSLTTIDDQGLMQINGNHLQEIYLGGASGITDEGIISLVDKLPNLKQIDLSRYILRKPMGEQETVAPQISEELIKTLSDKGIQIIQNDRYPWF